MKRVWEGFEMENKCNYHDLYDQRDILLPADAFENFSKMCKTCINLNLPSFLLQYGLVIRIKSINLYCMFLIKGKGIRGRICHGICQYIKANNKYIKNKESSYLKHWDTNNLHGWAISQKLPIGSFKWDENTSQI